MGFTDEQIKIFPSGGLTYVEVVETILEQASHTSTSLRPHTRTQPLIRPTTLPIGAPVLARWPGNGGKYAGRIRGIHGDIRNGFAYDVLFCDGDYGRELPSTEMRLISEQV